MSDAQYMACVALGFSLIENYFYAVDGASDDYDLPLTRMLSRTLDEICAGTIRSMQSCWCVPKLFDPKRIETEDDAA